MNYKALVMSLLSVLALSACTGGASGSSGAVPNDPTVVIDDPVETHLLRYNNADGININYERQVVGFSTSGSKVVSRKVIVRNNLEVGVKLATPPVFITTPTSESDQEVNSFTQTNDCPAILAPAQSCLVTVSFDPSHVAGSKFNQILAVGGNTDDSNGDEVQTMTQLTAVVSPQNSFTSASAGTFSASVGSEVGHPNFDYIAVSNQSGGAVHNFMFSDLGGFNLIATNCSEVLKAGDSCFIFTDGRNAGTNASKQITLTAVDYLGNQRSITATLSNQPSGQAQ